MLLRLDLTNELAHRRGGIGRKHPRRVRPTQKELNEVNLFLCSASGGVASIPIHRIKDAESLTVARGDRRAVYSFTGHPGTNIGTSPTGELRLILTAGEQYVDLARWPDAVAVLVDDTLYWLDDSHFEAHPVPVDIGFAVPLIERAFFPGGYELPTAATIPGTVISDAPGGLDGVRGEPSP